jgi:hypothetical protein
MTDTKAVDDAAADTKPAADVLFDTKPAADTKPAETTDTPADTTADTKPAADAKPAGTDGADPAPEAFDASKLTLPDGSPLEDAVREAIAHEAKTLTLTTDQAQQLLNHRDAQVKSLASELMTQLKADPELGGSRLEASIELARRGRDVVFPPGSKAAAVFQQFWDGSGLGNHPEFVREFARLGRAVKSDTTPSGKTIAPKAELSIADRLFPSSAPAAR